MNTTDTTAARRKALSTAIRREMDARGVTTYRIREDIRALNAAKNNEWKTLSTSTMKALERGDNSYTVDSLLLYLEAAGLILTVQNKAGDVVYNSEATITPEKTC